MIELLRRLPIANGSWAIGIPIKWKSNLAWPTRLAERSALRKAKRIEFDWGCDCLAKERPPGRCGRVIQTSSTISAGRGEPLSVPTWGQEPV
jgi:hypothetical protein